MSSKTEGSGGRTVSVRLDPHLIAILDQLGKEKGMNRSDVLRDLVSLVSGDSEKLPEAPPTRKVTRRILSVEGLENVEVMVLIPPHWDISSLRAFMGQDYFFLQITRTMTISIHRVRLPSFPVTEAVEVEKITFLPPVNAE